MNARFLRVDPNGANGPMLELEMTNGDRAIVMLDRAHARSMGLRLLASIDGSSQRTLEIELTTTTGLFAPFQMVGCA